MKDLRDRIAAAIRAARKAQGLSQEALAEAIDVAPEHLSALERGVNAPSIETFAALVRSLHLDANRLLGRQSPKAGASKARLRLEADAITLADALPDDALRELVEIGAMFRRRNNKP